MVADGIREIARRGCRAGQQREHDIRRHPHEPGEELGRRHDFPQVGHGGGAKGQKPDEESQRGPPPPAHHERRDQSGREQRDLPIRSAAQDPVDHDRVVTLAERHRLKHGHVGVRLARDVQRGLDDMDGVAQVGGRGPLKPPHLERGGERERNRQARDRRQNRPRLPRPQPDDDQQPWQQQGDFVAERRARAKQRARRERRPPRRHRDRAGKRGRSECDRRRVLPAADRVEPQRPAEPERDQHRDTVLTRRQLPGRVE